MQRSPTPEEVAAALERAYARPELVERENPLVDALTELAEWIAGLFDWDVDFAPSDLAGKVFLWAVLAALVAALVVLLVRQRRAAEAAPRSARGSGAATRVAERVGELRARARAAEERGDWLEALRLHFFALVVGLGQRGDLEYRDAWTNRELLARGEPAPAVAAVLAPLVVELDARSFGTLTAGPDDVRRFAAACERLLGDVR